MTNNNYNIVDCDFKKPSSQTSPVLSRAEGMPFFDTLVIKNDFIKTVFFKSY